jgi:adenylate kinase family enzyme
MRRLVVTGVNGTGKSHLAGRLSAARPGVSLLSYDALRLTRRWAKRPVEETARDLARAIAAPAWIVECGPTLLRHVLDRAEALIWRDPPDVVRAWRLALRPWRTRGRTRLELTPGNVDWPLERYRFAVRSLRNGPSARAEIARHLLQAALPVRRYRRGRDLDGAVAWWAAAA